MSVVTLTSTISPESVTLIVFDTPVGDASGIETFGCAEYVCAVPLELQLGCVEHCVSSQFALPSPSSSASAASSQTSAGGVSEGSSATTAEPCSFTYCIESQP